MTANSDPTVVIPESAEKNIIKPEKHKLLVKPQDTDVYVVKEGDNLWCITKFMTDKPYEYEQVAKDNFLDDPTSIYPGQKLYFKKR